MSTKILRWICYFYRLCLRDCTGNDVAVIIIYVYDDATIARNVVSIPKQHYSIILSICRPTFGGAFVAAICIARAFLGFITNRKPRAKENAVFVCGQWIASHSFVASEPWKAVCEARRFANREARKTALPTARQSFMVQLSFHASSSSFPARIITLGITYVRTITRYYWRKRDKRSHRSHGRLKIITQLVGRFACVCDLFAPSNVKIFSNNSLKKIIGKHSLICIYTCFPLNSKHFFLPLISLHL